MRIISFIIYVIALALLVPVLILNLCCYVSQDFASPGEENAFIAARNPVFSFGEAVLVLAVLVLLAAVLVRFLNHGTEKKAGSRMMNQPERTTADFTGNTAGTGRSTVKSSAWKTAVVLVSLMVMTFVIGICWIRRNPLYPSADQQAVWEMGAFLNDPEGDLPFTYTPNYWIKFPRQKCIALFMALVIRVTGSTSIRSFEYLNVLSAVLLIPEMYCLGKYSASEIASWRLHETAAASEEGSEKRTGALAGRSLSLTASTGETAERTVGILSAMLTFLCVPVVIYTSYIYPTLLSLAAMTAAFDLMSAAVRRLSVYRKCLLFLLSALCMAFANLLYAATLIGTIALGTVAVLYAISGLETAYRQKKVFTVQEDPGHETQKKKAGRTRKALTVLLPFLTILLAVLLVRIGRASAERIFDARTGVAESEGVPAAAWVLMGITSDSEDSVAGPGSYDAMVEWVYKDHDYNTAATSQYVNEEIRNALRQYRTGERDLDFFVRKTIYQWCDPWFSSLAMAADTNSLYMLDEDALARYDMYREFLASCFMQGLQRMLTFMQTGVYLGAVVGLVMAAAGLFRAGTDRKACRCFTLLPAIFFIGGFLFQLFWESKARYCLPYYICLFPMAAYGAAAICRQVRNCRQTTCAETPSKSADAASPSVNAVTGRT